MKMMRAISTLFPECEETKQSLEFVSSIEGNEQMQKMLIMTWNAEMKQYKKLVQKKDSKLFKKIKDVHLIKGLELHKKWQSKTLSMKSRDTLWKYIETLTDMAGIEAGEMEPAVQQGTEAIDRIQKKLGITVSEDGKTGNIDIPKVTEFVTQSLGDPSGENFKDMMDLAGVFGGLMGMKDLPDQMQQHYATATAQDSQQEKPLPYKAKSNKKK